MLKTSGHVKKHYKPVCLIFETFKDRGTQGATIDEYIKAVEEQAITYSVEDERMTFKGDMLEIFAEIFFKAFENNPAIGLTNYECIPLDEDYGVDGKGVNANGVRCAVQCKYRGNPLDLVTYSEIARTYTSGRIQLGLELDTDNCIFVFTTAIGVNIQCQKVFGNKVRAIGKDVIGREINNNGSFWRFAFKEISDTLLGDNNVVKKVIVEDNKVASSLSENIINDTITVENESPKRGHQETILIIDGCKEFFYSFTTAYIYLILYLIKKYGKQTVTTKLNESVKSVYSQLITKDDIIKGCERFYEHIGSGYYLFIKLSSDSKIKRINYLIKALGLEKNIIIRRMSKRGKE